MSKIFCLSILIIAFSCTSSKTNETTADSTQNQVTDVLAIQSEKTVSPSSVNESVQVSSTVETEEPFSGITNQFPQFFMATLTTDSLEVEINKRMGKLIQAYDTVQYARITSSYKWERPYCLPSQDGPCAMSVDNQGETKTWFFDRANQLRAFSRQYESDTYGSYTLSILYLLSGDSLIATSEFDFDQNDAVSIAGQARMFAPSCPRCGIAASAHGDRIYGEMSYNGLNGEASYLNEKDLANKQKEFNEAMSELISILKDGLKKAKEEGDDLVFSINRTKEGDAEHKAKAITYPVEFRVTKSLYPNYISRK
jgi:hypothetical protein